MYTWYGTKYLIASQYLDYIRIQNARWLLLKNESLHHTGRTPLVESSNEPHGASYIVVVRLRVAVLGRVADAKPTILSRVKEVVMPVVQVFHVREEQCWRDV